jgi:hypothetical protein
VEKEIIPSVTMMLSRVKLVPFVLESGVGLDGRENVKVLPPPVRVNPSVSALAVKLAARKAAKERALMGRFISLNSFQRVPDMKLLSPVLVAAGDPSMGGCRFLLTIVGCR